MSRPGLPLHRLPAGLLALLLGLSASPVLAQTADGRYLRSYTELAAGQDEGPWWSLTLEMLLKLGLVIVLIYLSAWALRRFLLRGRLWTGTQGVLTVLEMLPLGPQRTLYLVAVGPKLLVIGATGQHLTTLAEFDAATAEALRQQIAQNGPFAAALAAASATSPDPRSPLADGRALVAEALAELRALGQRWRGQTTGRKPDDPAV